MLTSFKLVLIKGHKDTRAKSGKSYDTITLAKIAQMAEVPNRLCKLDAPALRRSSPGPWCVPRVPYSGMDDLLRRSLRTKLQPNEFTTLTLKPRGPRRGALGLGGPGLDPTDQM